MCMTVVLTKVARQVAKKKKKGPNYRPKTKLYSKWNIGLGMIMTAELVTDYCMD